MGTSKSHTGPVSPDWTKAKGQATRWAKAGGGQEGPGIARVIAAAIAALASGGDGLLGSGGQEAGQKVGGLLGDLVERGPEEAFRERGLDHLIGLDGVDLHLALLEYLDEDGREGLEHVAVRDAIDAVVEVLVDAIDEPDHVWSEEEVSGLLVLFWTRYIAQLVMVGIAESILRASPAASETRHQEIVDYVQAQLELRFTRASVLDVDWAGAEGAQITSEIQAELIEILRGDE